MGKNMRVFNNMVSLLKNILLALYAIVKLYKEL